MTNTMQTAANANNLTGNQKDILHSIKMNKRNRADLAMRFYNSDDDVNVLISLGWVVEGANGIFVCTVTFTEDGTSSVR